MSIKARDYGISLISQLKGLDNIHDKTLTDVEKALGRISAADVGLIATDTGSPFNVISSKVIPIIVV